MDAINTQSKKFLGWILALALILGAGFYLFERNIGTVNIPGDKTLDITGKGETGGDKVVSLPGFKLPAGFSLSIFAKNVPDARVIEIGTQNEILVSETSEGKIVALEDTNNDGVATSKQF